MTAPRATSTAAAPGSGGRSTRGIRDRIVEFRRVRASELIPHPMNWRIHPPHQRAALRGLLREVGYADALIARRDENGRLVLIDGHLRQSLDPDAEIPVLILDVDEREGQVLLASLDPLASLAGADPVCLAELLASVQVESAAVRDLLARVARSAGIALAGRTDPEDIPVAPSRPRTRPGDLFELGEHRLLCGDATSAQDLARLVDECRPGCLWTDPPYGVSYVGKTRSALRIAGDGAAGLPDLLRGAFAAADGVLAPGAALYVAHPAGPLSITFGERFLAQGWQLRQTLVWAKDAMVLGRSDYHYQHEPILYGYKPGGGRRGRGARGWYGGNAQTSVLEVPRPRVSHEHPTAKPVELVRRCLANSTREGEAVLDPFAGSGSTLMAAHMLGIRCLALELDPRYCDVIIRRWEEHTGERARRTRRAPGRRLG